MVIPSLKRGGQKSEGGWEKEEEGEAEPKITKKDIGNEN